MEKNSNEKKNRDKDKDKDKDKKKNTENVEMGMSVKEERLEKKLEKIQRVGETEPEHVRGPG